MKRSRPFYHGLDDSNLPDLDLDEPDAVAAHFDFDKPKDNTCPDCRKTFSCRSSVKRHISSAHQSGQRFECESCDYSSSRRDLLKQHVSAKHTNARFDCERCASSFSYKGDLTRHVSEKHLKPRRFSCDSCSFSTSRRLKLETHVDKKHGDRI